MTMLERPTRSRSRWTIAVLCLAVAVLTIAALDGQPFHAHKGLFASLYNEDCPLANLAAFSATSALLGSAPTAWICFVAGAPPGDLGERLSHASAPSTTSRAPPAPLA